MPRPGPRPYECVRRAWHSDRHQPIRGSVIQDLFRVANEIHSAKTRENKEWQQKLPFVVLKAEEIMYSKASSEAEYVDPATLLERANDAIDTVIRKEDADETGDFLQPCIEAALNLGCIPRRASRSERHNAPRCYLSSISQEPLDQHGLLDLNVQPRSPCSPPSFGVHVGQTLRGCGLQFSSRFSPLGPANFGSVGLPDKGDPQIGFPRPSLDPERSASSLSDVDRELQGLGRAYPLYYPSGYGGLELGSGDTALGSHGLGRKVIETSCPYDFLGPRSAEGLSDGSSSWGSGFRDAPGLDFDLSLRLGPPGEGFLNGGRSWLCELEDVASNSSYSGSRL